jgi:hypothetical protein
MVIFGSNNGLNFYWLITLRRKKGSYVPRAITLISDNFSMM